jgi:hypothetical protein
MARNKGSYDITRLIEDAKKDDAEIDLFERLKQRGKSITFDYNGIPIVQFPSQAFGVLVGTSEFMISKETYHVTKPKGSKRSISWKDNKADQDESTTVDFSKSKGLRTTTD